MKEIFMTFTRFCDNFEFRDHVPSKSPSAIVCRLSSTVYRLCVLVHAVSEKGKLVEIVWNKRVRVSPYYARSNRKLEISPILKEKLLRSRKRR